MNGLHPPLNYLLFYRITLIKLKTPSFLNDNCKWKKSCILWKISLMSRNSFLHIPLTFFIHGTEMQLCLQETIGHRYRQTLTSLSNVIIHQCLWKDGGRREKERNESFYIFQVNNLLVWFKLTTLRNINYLRLFVYNSVCYNLE